MKNALFIAIATSACSLSAFATSSIGCTGNSLQDKGQKIEIFYNQGRMGGMPQDIKVVKSGEEVRLGNPEGHAEANKLEEDVMLEFAEAFDTTVARAVNYTTGDDVFLLKAEWEDYEAQGKAFFKGQDYTVTCQQIG